MDINTVIEQVKSMIPYTGTSLTYLDDARDALGEQPSVYRFLESSLSNINLSSYSSKNRSIEFAELLALLVAEISKTGS